MIFHTNTGRPLPIVNGGSPIKGCSREATPIRGRSHYRVFAYFRLAERPGQPPVVTRIFPIGGKQGSEFELTAVDPPETWPSAAWADHPGIKLEPIMDKKGVYKTAIALDTWSARICFFFTTPMVRRDSHFSSSVWPMRFRRRNQTTNLMALNFLAIHQ